jgi:hypothetical protein
MRKISKLFTIPQVTAITGIKEYRLRNFIRHDLLPMQKIGNKIYFDLNTLIEIKCIVTLDLLPNQVQQIRQYFESINLSNTLADKWLLVFDRTIIYVENLNDLTLLTKNCMGQKLIGQVLLPDLYAELRTQAKVLKIDHYQEKFSIAC